LSLANRPPGAMSPILRNSGVMVRNPRANSTRGIDGGMIIAVQIAQMGNAGASDC
jgi:hypothetical protein